MLAGMISVVKRQEERPLRLTTLAQALIDRYGNDQSVLDGLAGNIGAFSWVGARWFRTMKSRLSFWPHC